MYIYQEDHDIEYETFLNRYGQVKELLPDKVQDYFFNHLSRKLTLKRRRGRNIRT